MSTNDELITQYLLDPENTKLPAEMYERDNSEDWIEKRIRQEVPMPVSRQEMLDALHLAIVECRQCVWACERAMNLGLPLLDVEEHRVLLYRLRKTYELVERWGAK